LCRVGRKTLTQSVKHINLKISTAFLTSCWY